MLVDWSGDAKRVRVRAKMPGPADWLDIETLVGRAPGRRRSSGRRARRASGSPTGRTRSAPLAPSSTEVAFELRIETMPRREKVLAPLVKPYLQRVNDKAMKRLKEHAESL